MEKLEKVIHNLIDDIPEPKLRRAIRTSSLVKGIWGMIKAYGIPYSKENHETLVDLVQNKLAGPDIEVEWTEEQYNNFVCYNEIIL
jgi:hypothetical protein